MTYGLGLLLDDGVVLLTDTRSNAGVDHIATVNKLNLFSLPGSHALALASAGNLATTQALVTLLNQRLGQAGNVHNLFDAQTMFDAARMVGAVLREVMAHDANFVQGYGDPSASLLLGGQIQGGPHRLFLIYAAGNFIEAGADTPFLQIGEPKYGKPILDRVMARSLSLAEAAKIALLSFDATVRSNLSVAPPFDIYIHQRDRLDQVMTVRIEEDDPYFREIREGYSSAIAQSVGSLRNPPWAP